MQLVKTFKVTIASPFGLLAGPLEPVDEPSYGSRAGAFPLAAPLPEAVLDATVTLAVSCMGQAAHVDVAEQGASQP